ncbi:MAG: hypothetical protein IPG10_20365 [Flavobacteriales bacterium]|nr:hypothetical protein [Flavobacteriales bacterium]
MLARNILIALLGHGVSAQAQDIVSGEYWVDTDPGWGQGFPINGLPLQEEVSSHAFIIPTNALAQGIHTIGYRTKDAQGRWSHTNHGTLLVLAQEEQSPIARTVYFFNSDPGLGGRFRYGSGWRHGLIERVHRQRLSPSTGHQHAVCTVSKRERPVEPYQPCDRPRGG